MIIYRYEYPDGGGPFLTRYGISRTNPIFQFNDNTLHGCDSIEHLKEWFTSRNIELPEEIQIKAYEGEVVLHYITSGEVIIRKDTAKRVNI